MKGLNQELVISAQQLCRCLIVSKVKIALMGIRNTSQRDYVSELGLIVMQQNPNQTFTETIAHKTIVMPLLILPAIYPSKLVIQR